MVSCVYGFVLLIVKGIKFGFPCWFAGFLRGGGCLFWNSDDFWFWVMVDSYW